MPSGSFGLVRHPNPTLEHMRVARAGAVSEPASKTADRIGTFPRPHDRQWLGPRLLGALCCEGLGLCGENQQRSAPLVLKQQAALVDPHFLG